MQVDFPGLAHAVRLDEVTFVVDVESMVGGEVLDISDERCDVDDCHRAPLLRPFGESGTYDTVSNVEALRIVELFGQVADAVHVAINQVPEWGLSGQRSDQYTIDVAADSVALPMLRDAGFGVLSEESGLTFPERQLIAVIDPIDGSTNASAGLPWFGTSLCAIDKAGPLASLVANQATGDRWHAVRGGGAFKNNVPIAPSGVERLGDAFLAVSGLPSRHFGWRQFRAYGASALDLCSVADGTFDAFADLSVDAHGSWDYLGALLVCTEAGACIADVHDRDLVALGHADRRTPIAAASPALMAELLGQLRQ